MDETTHPFSDKVLDRAYTLEFWDVDLEGWRAAAQARGVATCLTLLVCRWPITLQEMGRSASARALPSASCTLFSPKAARPDAKGRPQPLGRHGLGDRQQPDARGVAADGPAGGRDPGADGFGIGRDVVSSVMVALEQGSDRRES